MMVKIRRPAFNVVHHVNVVAEIPQEDVWEDRFGPDVFGCVKGMPFVYHGVIGSAVEAFCEDCLRVTASIAVCPCREGERCMSAQGRSNSSVI